MKKKVPNWKRYTNPYPNLNPLILRSSLISQLATKVMRDTKSHALCSNFLKMSPKLVKTLEPFALVKGKAKAFTIKATSSIESFAASWRKVVTLQPETVLEVFLSTAINLLMSRYGTLTLTRVCSPWPMQARTQMEASSSFVLDPLLISTKSIPSSAEQSTDTKSVKRLKRTRLARKTSPSNQLRLWIAVSF